MNSETLKPKKVSLHKKSKTLEVAFSDSNYHLSAEFLRTHSPSAEVKGHGPGQETLVYGKIDVGIESIKAVGNYGIQINFDDKHDSGIFAWSYLQELGMNESTLWKTYLDKLAAENKNRDPNITVVQFQP